MTEFRTPGVYVEETSFRARSIEGVPTSTTAFVGPTRTGPAGTASDVLTSVGDFERQYGSGGDLVFAGNLRTPDFMWHAARAFFANGGRRLHVVRVQHADEGVPEAADYASALQALESLPEVAIVAAPGSTYRPAQVAERDDRARIHGIHACLLAHADRMRYRVALLDSAVGQTPADVRDIRAGLESSRAALYYPWVRVADPASSGEVLLPPSPFVAGICARVDLERGVHKAPANETVTLAVGLERDLTRVEQDILNPLGINCLRRLEGRGVLVWGARTLTADSEWKYVNVRRLLAFLEHSIDKGTQWVVFEPNDQTLWTSVRRLVEDFLLQQWTAGALVGSTADEAFFVRCDRTTMTQNDLDDGRLVCLIGVAPARPAEFVIFRIGRWTADRRP
jgi:hypothetical protein